MKPGVRYSRDGISEFTVWAPFLNNVELKLTGPRDLYIPLLKRKKGYWSVQMTDLAPDANYLYRLDNDREMPDPASHYQPRGVHHPSQVVDHAEFAWTDKSWRGLPLFSMVLYEVHTGVFTPEGTFDAVIARLDALKDLGITALELMPVAQFPGARNWGYDGAYPFAVQNSYGGPDGLKRLVDACHARGMAAVLDVVYNHLGPEGAYLWNFGPYFTNKYRTPWGQAVNFDSAYCDEVRAYYIENALHWIRNYHIDALRLDAIHEIYDFSARHILADIGDAVHLEAEALGRIVHVIAESDLNDVRVINSSEIGGHGLDAQWSDDFHHALHALVTGERKGYYADFGSIGDLEKAYRESFVYSGVYSRYRKRRYGNDARDRPARQFVVFSQNHDQTGNRMLGDRLSALVEFEALKLAAATVILSPYIPLLFMGEEYGEKAPFLYFVSHTDPELIEAVRKGRKKEFADSEWEGEPPDPEDEATFLRSKLNWSSRVSGRHKILHRFYRTLLMIRRDTPALAELEKRQCETRTAPDNQVLFVRRWNRAVTGGVFMIFNFEKHDLEIVLPLPAGTWTRLLDSSEKAWDGPGTLAPDPAETREKATVRGSSIVLYAGKDGE